MSTKFPDAAELRGRMEKAREDYAREIFDYNTVDRTIDNAAFAGGSSVRIGQERPFLLKDTKAARGLVEKLKKAGFVCEWETVRVREKVADRETGFWLVYKELCIRWGPDERTGAELGELEA